MGPFEEATKVAIEEIILKNAQTSKFGYVISQETLQEVTEEIYGLLVTSRTLKNAGDKFLGKGMPTPTTASTPRNKGLGHGAKQLIRSKLSI